MDQLRTLQKPLALTSADKRDARTQFGALCYRVRKDKPQVLLISSRGTGRWIIPKGWPMAGSTPAEAATIEAWEEAGVRGRVHGPCLGFYSYDKRIESGEKFPCIVAVFAVSVAKLADDYPEADQRKRKWVSVKKAAKMVKEPELARIISRFSPRILRI
ncbi:NUDIX hydrolase [Aliiroseovarius sp. PTFE2010]|uniref:NUDIX hydrolase n=1 Tax=Aliiroseovarius sp. PTFE2010 TaxID=3417190 RepID=UPI003CF7800B